MSLYLAEFVEGPRGYGFKVAGIEPGRPYGSINLRPDNSVRDGYALLWSPGPSLVPHPQIDRLADNPAEPMAGASRRVLERKLGITFEKTGSVGNHLGDLLVNDRGGRLGPVARSNRHGLIEVRLGGMQWYSERVEGRGEVALDPLDDFNRTNETPLVGDWTTPTGGDAVDMDLIGNEVAGSAGTSECCAYWNREVFDPDCFSQVLIVTRDDGATRGPGPTVRMETTGLTGYFAGANSVDEVSLYSYDGDSGSWNEFASGGACADGDTLRIEADGTTIRALVNGVEQLSVTDTTLQPTQTRIGIQSYSAGGDTLDDWQGGNLFPGDQDSEGETVPEAGALDPRDVVQVYS